MRGLLLLLKVAAAAAAAGHGAHLVDERLVVDDLLALHVGERERVAVVLRLVRRDREPAQHHHHHHHPTARPRPQAAQKHSTAQHSAENLLRRLINTPARIQSHPVIA